MTRTIGISHRVKKTKDGEARPTLVAVLENGALTETKLTDEDGELAFVKTGLQAGDTVAMILGGSGDRFAASLSRQGERVGAQVIRIPPFLLKQHRNGSGADEDHKLLVELATAHPGLFYQFRAHDRDLIRVKEAYYARQEAQDARIQCENRVRARLVGSIFLSEDGGFPEGKIEDSFDAVKANDKILQALLEEEKLRNKDLKVAVHRLPIWGHYFEKLEGCGETIAAGLIAAIGDIRRFSTAAKLKKFCGVNVEEDGSFVRRRAGQIANWHPEARQALYQLAEQFNRRPDSEWGLRLREFKARLREKHPEIETVNGKKRYTDGHIHKRALWRSMTKVVEALYFEWTKLEAA